MGQIAMKWTGEDSQLFIGRDSYGHMVVSGSWPKDADNEWIEWKASKPSDLLLLSLCACSGYDVVMILKRQRQRLTDLYITAEAQQMPEPPHAFTDIHLHYTVTGYDLEPAKVKRAIELSQDKYCSVAATIRGVAKITYAFDVKPAHEPSEAAAAP